MLKHIANLGGCALICAALTGPFIPTGWATPIRHSAGEIQFDVYLDQRRIGTHRVRIEQDFEHTRVTTEAAFEVRFLFLRAYRYQHLNSELWRNGCLTQIQSTTNDNGERLRVHGEAQGSTFAIETAAGPRQLSGCIRSFAYWDLQSLSSERLLNTQTGEYLPTQLSEPKAEFMQHGGQSIEVASYTLTASPSNIQLSYGLDGDWLSLQTQVSGGRTLRYERRSTDHVMTQP